MNHLYAAPRRHPFFRYKQTVYCGASVGYGARCGLRERDPVHLSDDVEGDRLVPFGSDYAERARQLVLDWKASDFISALNMREGVLTDRITAFASTVAMEARAATIEEAAGVAERADSWAVQGSKGQRIAEKIRSLQPSSDFLDKLRDEARAVGVSEGVTQVWEVWEGAIRSLSTKEWLTPPEEVVKKLLDEARKEGQAEMAERAWKLAEAMAAGEAYETGRQKAVNIAAALKTLSPLPDYAEKLKDEEREEANAEK